MPKSSEFLSIDQFVDAVFRGAICDRDGVVFELTFVSSDTLRQVLHVSRRDAHSLARVLLYKLDTIAGEQPTEVRYSPVHGGTQWKAADRSGFLPDGNGEDFPTWATREFGLVALLLESPWPSDGGTPSETQPDPAKS